MKTHELDGKTICVMRKDTAPEFRYTDVVEVVEDYGIGAERKQLLIKERNIAVVTRAMFLSENVDRWWLE